MTFEPKKSLGQNFLHAPHIIAKMIHAGRVDDAIERDITVLEIGPGKGALTEKLLEAGTNAGNVGSNGEKKIKVVAVEKDDRAIPFLQEKFAAAIADGRLQLIHADIIEKIDEIIAGLGEYIVIANIPYYITGELLRIFLEHARQPQRMVLMVQKEVANRIVTRGDNGALDGKESILSISVKAFGKPKYIETVQSKYFRPEPNVDSAVLLIDEISHDFFKNSAKNIAIKPFFALVKAGFAHKRKVLIGNLISAKIADKETLDKLWITCGLNPKVRAEEVPLETWGKMAHLLTAQD